MDSTKYIHRKELEIKHLLKENSIPFTYDKRVQDGCSARRPDFRIRTNWGHIIVEVDEHQHRGKSYTPECERTRMLQIHNDIGEFYTLFVRYNPDAYVTHNTNVRRWTKRQRHEYLVKFIHECINQQPPDHLSVVHLFFDGFDPQTPVVFHKIE